MANEKLYVVQDGPAGTHKDFAALFAYHGTGAIRAHSLRSNQSTDIAEGYVGHASFAGPAPTGILVSGLLYCSAVLYLYVNGGALTDVVAFHSPSGGANIKFGPRKGTAFGSPSEEAVQYGINMAQVYVVIANGPMTNNFPDREQRLADINTFMRGPLQTLVDNLKGEAAGQNVMIYEHASSGLFGVNAQGHIGEPGAANPAQAVQAQAQQEKTCGKCCFITTAACGALGLPDDCAPLAVLRWYRDCVLATSAQGRSAIEEYYRIAPGIVAAIDAHENAASIYRDIAATMIGPAVAAIRTGHYEEAFRVYRNETAALKQRYLPPTAPHSR